MTFPCIDFICGAVLVTAADLLPSQSTLLVAVPAGGNANFFVLNLFL